MALMNDEKTVMVASILVELRELFYCRLQFSLDSPDSSDEYSPDSDFCSEPDDFTASAVKIHTIDLTERDPSSKKPNGGRKRVRDCFYVGASGKKAKRNSIQVDRRFTRHPNACFDHRRKHLKCPETCPERRENRLAMGLDDL
jgi:hypothetical protein